VHEPARLAILTVLASCESVDFTFLEAATGLTKGNLSSPKAATSWADIGGRWKRFAALPFHDS
jgi:hypothetical protein